MTDEEREMDNCLIMRIKKLKEQVKNLIQQVIGSCILAFTKNKKEKRITELEQENAELREKYLQATDEGTSFAHLKSLERENTKLDMKRKAERQIFQGIVEKKNEQLTEATEVIRMVIDSYNHKERFSFEKDLAKAEQFLEKVK